MFSQKKSLQYLPLPAIVIILTLTSRSAECASDKADLFELNVIHLNDFHARFDETNAVSGPCENLDECIGGLARVASVVKKLKTKPNSLLLNAGDNFQGTVWYNLFKWNVTQHFMNALPFDAFTLGNHEFDDKIAGIVPFMQQVKAPIVVSNIDDHLEPSFQGLYNKSVVVERGGKKIGIVGVTISSMHELSSPEKLIFLDEVESINKEAQRLVDEEDVFTNIVVSHCGYDRELEIAGKVGPKVTLIVGGHSHSLLYNGTSPNGNEAAGPYPTVVGREDGRMVLVVQASSYTKYLGNLTMFYDEDGHIVSYDGVPVFLSNSTPKDEEMLQELAPWKEAADAYGDSFLGTTKYDLDNSNCFYDECTFGDFITDVMVDSYRSMAEEGQWTYAAIAVTNPGSIRTPILAGNITVNDILTAQPFENTVDVGEVEGKFIKAALEFGSDDSHRRRQLKFTSVLQVSGLKMVIDFDKPSGDRVSDIKVRCNNCSEPVFEDLDLEKTYRIIMGSFLVHGGDGFTMLSDNLKNHQIGPVDRDMYIKYIRENSPIEQQPDGRITVINHNERSKRNAQIYNSL